MSKKKPYKYNSKSRLTSDSQSFPFKVKSIKKDVKTNLENTLTKLRIVEDDKEEKEVLDKGFLEGRLFKESKKSKKKKEVKEKEVKEKEAKESKNVEIKDNKKIITFDKNFFEKLAPFRNLFIFLAIACILIIFIKYSFSYIHTKISNLYNNKKLVVEKSKVDNNYLFVGDYHIQNISFEKYGLDYHYVNNGNANMTTSDLLDTMKRNVYDYNPSMVFIELGTNDLKNGVSMKTIRNNYSNIIESIKKNRPYAVIVIESVFPINRNYSKTKDYKFSNDDIEVLNDSLRSLAIEKDVKYFDAYSLLSKNNELNPEYTNDGIHVNDKGISVLYDNINKLIG